ncbi:integrase catalytic domain-containing protein [Trichonephila clavipes]|nr:integrase catalytic domain-containing protein [Trichonephila clavipes]
MGFLRKSLVTMQQSFNSFESKTFAKEWDFEYNLVRARYPKSNGLVERAVGILLNLKVMKKVDDSNKDWIVGLMEYRNTLISGLYLSPAQLLFGHRLNQGWADFFRVRSTSNILKVLRSVQVA